MANALYDRGRQGFLAADIDWDGDNIRLILIDEGVDVPDLANDEDLADRATAARISTSGNFTAKTVTDGVADAADITMTAVTGSTVESIDIYQHTGVEGTSLMIANIDTATGLVLTPNGGDVTVQWDAGANRIFKL
jgi:hypothetical protein